MKKFPVERTIIFFIYYGTINNELGGIHEIEKKKSSEGGKEKPIGLKGETFSHEDIIGPNLDPTN